MRKNYVTFWQKLCLLVATVSFFSSANSQNIPIRLLQTFKFYNDRGYLAPISSMALSHDGTTLVTCGSEKDPNGIKLWNTKTKWSILLQGHTAGVSAIAFSPDGKLVATGDSRGYIKAWNTGTGLELFTLRKEAYDIRCLAFSPNGKMLASGTLGGTELWDMQSKNQVKTITASHNILSVAFSPDGKTIASTAYGDDDKRIRLWDRRTGIELKSFGQFPVFVSVSYLDFRDTQTLLSFNAGDFGHEKIPYAYRFWDVNIGLEKNQITFYPENVTGTAISPDDKILAIGYNNYFWLKEAMTGKLLCVTNDRYVSRIAFSRNCEIMATADGGKINVWDISMLKPELTEIYLPIQKEKDTEIQKIASQFKSKDEFETDAEYRTRITAAKADSIAIDEKYYQKYLQARSVYSEQKNREIQARIRESRTEVTLKISDVGTYDANSETFPITIEGVTKDIAIPRSEARGFKENFQSAIVKGYKQLKRDLVTYEYVDVIILHPETSTRYPFVD